MPGRAAGDHEHADERGRSTDSPHIRLTLVLVTGLTFVQWSAAARAAPAASSTFCDDSAQLQDWIAQHFQPGIDQYGSRPNPSYVGPMAQYLHKLSREAPAVQRSDLTVSATFTGPARSPTG